jgi:hypothetical protein
MSIVFEPKIKAKMALLAGLPPSLEMEEIDLLVKLRALKMSYEDCAKILKRDPGHCSGTVHRLGLYSTISKRREILISKELKPTMAHAR